MSREVRDFWDLEDCDREPRALVLTRILSRSIAAPFPEGEVEC